MKRLIWILLLAAAPLAAQDSTATDSTVTKHLREGFWLRIGLGYGWIDGNLGGDLNEELEAFSAPSGFLALGGQPSANVGIGVTVNSLRESKSDEKSLSAIIAPTVFWHDKNSGFYTQFAIGLAIYTEETTAGDFSGTGFGLMAGLGIDLRVARNLSITPYGNLIYSRLGSLEFEGRNVPGINMSTMLYQIGASLTVH